MSGEKKKKKFHKFQNFAKINANTWVLGTSKDNQKRNQSGQNSRFSGNLFYRARHVIAAHLEHLQLVPNLLKIFGTPSSVSVQLG